MLLPLLATAWAAELAVLPPGASARAAPDAQAEVVDLPASSRPRVAVVAGEQGVWVALRPRRPGEPHGCYPPLDVDREEPVWVRRADLAPVLTRRVQAGPLTAGPGVIAMSDATGAWIEAEGQRFALPFPDDAVGTVFSPEPLAAPEGGTWFGRCVHRARVPRPEVVHTEPPRMRRGMPGGTCVVEVRIGPDGAPTEVRPTDCDPAHHRVAERTLMRWRWSPPVGADGQPTTATAVISLEFERKDRW